ncbi:MAG: hypothetical protein ACOC10_10420 [Bacteroidota bacterium]
MNGLFWGILYLVVLAFLITLFFRFLLRVSGPWGSFWAFFTIVLLGILAADIWISPIGPYFADIYWVPPIAAGLVIALLLAATTPSPKARSELDAQKRVNKQEAAAVALGTFFWFLIIFLVIMIVVGLIFTE